ncbi:glucoamylase family protein [Mucilaginibacter myungsuensis]|uniref:Beta-glucosidase n=1 Tax=Mucilaginibacter myungsuensis TaxID=649104 RepID=A0A929L4L9_9SPHI|nr:glucoamylase family protein [Mucilaginibacter myungsuensis]MBE9664379.1 beta-glucosidase [Mucilaginibacter myungsuensis]MDN3597089.1 glucoamylase family protein [Mucilaginibacter myungsuensis]
MKKIFSLALLSVIIGCLSVNAQPRPADLTIKKGLTDAQLLTLVQKQTFHYFWDGAEPLSGLARERYHADGVYEQNDKDVIATGAAGFGFGAIVVGMQRGFITRKQGVERLTRQISFLEKAERFHGVWPHWMYNTGKVKPFGRNDDGGDLVETAYLAQGMLCVRQYLNKNNKTEKALAARIDKLWKGIEWDWYRNGGKDVLYWHWSPNIGWKMNFAVTGFNECMIMYIMAAASPTHTIPASVYHNGWARGGAIDTLVKPYGYDIRLKHNGAPGSVGSLFWAQYSYLGLNPKGLVDKYADYWQENRNNTLVNRAYCIDNPKKFKGYGEDNWGLTASYSVKGYAGHSPQEDLGVITPTAALSSYCYTPKESMKVIRHLYEDLGNKVWGQYGFYDAFSETDNWYPKRYLGIDQGPIVIMIENGRTGLLWNLFMSSPEVKAGLKKLGFKSPYLKK